jgi:hypothetical protein
MAGNSKHRNNLKRRASRQAAQRAAKAGKRPRSRVMMSPFAGLAMAAAMAGAVK